MGMEITEQEEKAQEEYDQFKVDTETNIKAVEITEFAIQVSEAETET